MAGRYELKARAERQRQTRQRIVEAAVDLHTTLGPAHTSDVAIAERAGVTRVTFYRHFPDDAALFSACTRHARERWPPPDPREWEFERDPAKRLHLALPSLYRYYRVVGRRLAVIVRDGPLLRPGLVGTPNILGTIGGIASGLAKGWGVRGRRRTILLGALQHAASVQTWQSLICEQGLEDEEAVALLEALVRRAVSAG